MILRENVEQAKPLVNAFLDFSQNGIQKFFSTSLKKTQKMNIPFPIYMPDKCNDGFLATEIGYDTSKD